MKDNQSVDIIIPTNVSRSNSISSNAKLLYGALRYFTEKDGYCYADDKDLSIFLKLTKETIRRKLNELKNINFVNIRKKQIGQLEMYVKLEKHGDRCAWCDRKTMVLNSHHHPIPKKLGGMKTVKICASCHMDFHFLNRIRMIKTIGG